MFAPLPLPLLPPTEEVENLRILHLIGPAEVRAVLIYGRSRRPEYDAQAGDALDAAIVAGLLAQRLRISHVSTELIRGSGQKQAALASIQDGNNLTMELRLIPTGDYEEMRRVLSGPHNVYGYIRNTAFALEAPFSTAGTAHQALGALCYIAYAELTEEAMNTFRPVEWPSSGQV